MEFKKSIYSKLIFEIIEDNINKLKLQNSGKLGSPNKNQLDLRADVMRWHIAFCKTGNLTVIAFLVLAWK